MPLRRLTSTSLLYALSDCKYCCLALKKNRIDRSEKTHEDLIGKPEECKKIAFSALQPLSNLASIGGARAHEVPDSNSAMKSLEPTYIGG